jgi:NAD(P)-dependent dehydrogenase (short-subunit alcohol dehydrogenase family)
MMIEGCSPTDTSVPPPTSSDLFGSGSVAFVTGGNKGIGLQTVIGLAKKGISVVMAARDASKGAEAMTMIAADHKDLVNLIEYCQFDGTNAASIEAAVKFVSDRYGGKLDILVNNAGIRGELSGIAETPEVMRAVYETNVIAPFQITKAFLPLLRQSKHPRIVNVSSAGASFYCVTQPNLPFKPSFAYTSSKAALNMITVQLARELAPDRILVNATDPGYCATDITKNSGPRTAEQGAYISVVFATIGDDGPTGTFYNEKGRHYW